MKKVIYVVALAFSLFLSNAFGMESACNPTDLAHWLASPAGQRILAVTLNPDTNFLAKFNLVVDSEVTYEGVLDGHVKRMLILLDHQFSTAVATLRACLAEFDRTPYLFVEDGGKKRELLQKMDEFITVRDRAFTALRQGLQESDHQVLDHALRMHQLFYCAALMISVQRFLFINDPSNNDERAKVFTGNLMLAIIMLHFKQFTEEMRRLYGSSS
jgi:hypothetical protein